MEYECTRQQTALSEIKNNFTSLESSRSWSEVHHGVWVYSPTDGVIRNKRRLYLSRKRQKLVWSTPWSMSGCTRQQTGLSHITRGCIQSRFVKKKTCCSRHRNKGIALSRYQIIKESKVRLFNLYSENFLSSNDCGINCKITAIVTW